jgi:integrase
LTRRRSNPLHPLVTVLKANKQKPRRARWEDPATGKRRLYHLPPDDVEAERWMIRKSAELLNHRARTEPPPGFGPALPLMIEKYLQEKHRRRPGTLAQYRQTLARFEKFAGSKPITQALLRAWRTSIDRPGIVPASVNVHLRHVKAFLNHRRKAGEIVMTSEQISDGLELLEDTSEKKKPLTRKEIAKLQRELIAANDPLYYRFVMVLLLTGMRRAECQNLNALQVGIDEIVLGTETKTRKGREIAFKEAPTVETLLGKDFDGWKLTADQLRSRRNQIHPWVTFQRMRATTGTYLACAGGIYQGSSAYMAARRLGHSVEIAERHYMGVIRDIPHDAKTLEAAMGLAAHPT